ncbi:MAG: hypothetical protein H7Y07_13885 [Pyrinomonadaceae bacterium]|nr:hypothetical protein [Sphingobacteriaceae bacterium]
MLKPEIDYYFNEQGLMVFTKEYHLKRGYCCTNGCLHCPWNKSGDKGTPNKSLKKTL